MLQNTAQLQHFRVRLACIGAIGLLLALTPGAASARQRCEALAGKALPASTMSLATAGAVITSSSPQTVPGTSGKYCRILGEIRSRDPHAHSILFQLNMPDDWNGKTIQFGGGGMNGMLVTGLDPAPGAPPGPSPLARGYATLGTDSGHRFTQPPLVQQLFANNEEAVNFGYAAYKKVHDLTRSIVLKYYGARPVHSYFIGMSEGGREAMIVAQKYPADFDGVIAAVPAIGWTGINIATYNFWARQEAGGWLNAGKVSLVHRATLAACDKLDGLEDGLIANYAACPSHAHASALRCPGGVDAGDHCLSDAQIELVSSVREATPFQFAAADGQKGYPGFGIGGEDQPFGFRGPVVDFDRLTDDRAMQRYGVANARIVLTGHLSLAGILDQAANASRLATISQLMDAMSPDLEPFAKRGGRLIILEHSADYIVSPNEAYAYVESVRERLGRSTDKFLRLYVAPGLNHMGEGQMGIQSVPNRVDLLSVLERWVEHKEEPGELTIGRFEENSTSPEATLPLCRYPAYPRFKGTGSTGKAESYACTLP